MHMPLPFHGSSIRAKLLFASTVVQVVFLTLLLANSVRLMNEATQSSITTLINQNASMLHAMAVSYGDDFKPLQDTLDELLADTEDGLVYVRITNATGEFLLRAGMPQLTTLPQPNTDIDKQDIANLLESPLIHMRSPLLLARNEVGYLQFGISVSALVAARQAIMRQGWMIAIAELAITIILLSVIAYLLTKRLARLVAGSQALTDGHLDHRLEDDVGDELATLARHFNIMASALQQRIDELQKSSARLKASEERYALSIQGANDGLWDWDIVGDRGYYSARFCELLGITVDGLVSDAATLEGKSTLLFEHLHPDEIGIFRMRMIEHLKGISPQFMLEHRIRHEDGGYHWIMTRGVALRNAEGRAIRMAGSISDIHLRKRAEQQLLHDALHDGLTGLPNQALFLEHLRQALAQQRRDNHQRFAVLAINLERFHLINDSYGHAAGDSLLRDVASHLASSLSAGDIVARSGGDQFIVLLHNVVDAEHATEIASKLVNLPDFTALNTHQILHTKCHIGLSMSDNGADAETLLRDADNALQAARRNGSSSPIQVFQASMHTNALSTLRLETDLRNALANEELAVHYQPIVRLFDHSIASFEALARWPHPTQGMISPAKFIPLAESLDLIHPLGMFVLRRTCQDIQEWHKQTGSKPPPVSVNLSARQLARPDLADELFGIISSYDLAPESLRFEVTESLITRSNGPAGETLRRLRESGIAVLIDDFGTGYSALSYLHTIPCDIIKLDGSFVSTITTDPRLRAIVRHSISLAHDLGMSVVTECIEDEDQENMLRAISCDFGQGYLFSRPIAAADICQLLVAVRQENH